MKDAARQTIYLKDYAPFGYIVESVHLTFRLAPSATRVISKIRFAPCGHRRPSRDAGFDRRYAERRCPRCAVRMGGRGRD